MIGGMIDGIQQLLREGSHEIGEWLALYHDQSALHINLQDLVLTHTHPKRIAAKHDVHSSDLLKLRWQVPWGF